jgi:hypothetical protein
VTGGGKNASRWHHLELPARLPDGGCWQENYFQYAGEHFALDALDNST